MKDFLSRISGTISKYNMLDGAESVLCGFSGGADSTALLFALRELCGTRGIKIYAAHVNHMIRGSEADSDMEHCRTVCEGLSIPIYVVKINVPAIAARDGIGLEEAARSERYAAFDSICAEHNIDRIAVAHNSGDNLETVLFNLIRGSGMRGMCGIPPVRGKIIRPLLECARADIIGYLDSLGEGYVTDSTNADNGYTRNYIRHEIASKLLNVSPAAERNVSRMCELLRQENTILDSMARDYDDNRLLERRIMSGYSDYTNGGSLEAVHVTAAAELVRRGRLWSSVSLPDSVRLTVTREGYEFTRDENVQPEADISVKLDYAEGLIPLARGGSAAILKDIKENINIYKISIYKTLNSAKIIGTVVVRYRRDGDVIRVGGHTKSVKKLLNERRISLDKRAVLPFYCDDAGILWIPDVALRDGTAYHEGDCKTVLIYSGD